MRLGFGISYQSLLEKEGLMLVDQAFFDYLLTIDSSLYRSLLQFRKYPESVDDAQYNDLILAVAPVMEAFLLNLFLIDANVFKQQSMSAEAVIEFRSKFIQVKRDAPASEKLSAMCFSDLTDWLLVHLGCSEEEVSQKILVDFGLGLCRNADSEAILYLQQWCFLVRDNHQWKERLQDWYIFWQPQKIGSCTLAIGYDDSTSSIYSKKSMTNERDDFSLIPSYWDNDQSMIHADYCKYCHDRSVDYCRSGFYQKKSDPDQGFRSNRSGQVLSGCPLNQKISQMHWLQRRHLTLSALIVVMIDNPFCLVTGHRICNDCMQSCIFQKQDPVDTPQVESGILRSVLQLPWGVEIVDLLIKWNPLRVQEFLPSSDNGRSVLIMGLGPAGFSMMHHLWMRGCSVTAMDGVFLQPWPHGDINAPIQDFSLIDQSLSDRVPLGFGGVCEYGITSRWDKNFLSVVYLSLLRRQNCHMIGGVRFGGTFTIDDAWELGFDHFVLATGAGLPKALNVPNSLAKGMFQASDFLMALQNSGAQSDQNVTSLTMQLPCVVIGAGLTAVDTATEAQTYYLHFVQLVYLRMTKLISVKGQQAVQEMFSQHDFTKLRLWFEHGRAIFAEKSSARSGNRPVCFRDLLRSWGGVRIVYRGGIEVAPAYRSNHAELQAALDAGIIFQEKTDVCAVDVDDTGSVSRLSCLQPWGDISCEAVSICRVDHSQDSWRCSAQGHVGVLYEGMVIRLFDVCKNYKLISCWWKVLSVKEDSFDVKLWQGSAAELSLFLHKPCVLTISEVYRDCYLDAKTVLVATGSQPNTAYAYEHKGYFERCDGFYKLFELSKDGRKVEENRQQSDQAFFTSYYREGKRVSVIGDLHPKYHGSVVKALASSQAAVSDIMRHMVTLPFTGNGCQSLENMFSIVLLKKKHLFSDYHTFTIYAPWIVKKFSPGHLIKLQVCSFGEKSVIGVHGQESVACQPYDYDKQAKTLSFVLKEDSWAKKMLLRVPEGGALMAMGPTGVRLPRKQLDKRVLLLADHERLSSACLYARHYELYSAGVDFLVVKSEIALRLASSLSISSQVKWCDIEDLPLLSFATIDIYSRIILQGSFSMMRSFNGVYNQHVKKTDNGQYPELIGYVGGPMQCMLKGICAQCLQWQIDPQTGLRTKAVFSCSWQDQPLSMVDMNHYEQRQERCKAFAQLNEQWTLCSLSCSSMA